MSTHKALRGGGTVDDTAWVDPTAYINGTASVGARSYVGAGAYVNPGVTIGTDSIICDRVRVVANVPNFTTLLCDCCSGGGSTPGGGTILNLDSIHTVGARLDAVVTTGMVKGTLAYVGNDTFAGQHSVHRYYELVYGEALVADGIEIVNSVTFGVDGAQWLSQDTVDQQALTKGFWAIDEAAGSDENTGWGVNQAAADAFPLKTMRELNRRLFGANITGPLVIHQLSTITFNNFTPLYNLKTATEFGYPIWLGKKTTLFSGAVTTYAAAVPAANTGVQLNLASIPVSWTASGLVGLSIENAAGTKIAWVQKDLGAKTARITQPCLLDVSAFSLPIASSFAPGEVVNVLTLPVLPAYPFGDDVGFSGVSDVHIADVNTESNTYSTSVFFGRTNIGSNIRATASTSGSNVGGCLFNAAGLFISGGIWATTYCGLRNCQLVIQFGAEFAGSNSPFDLQTSRILVTNGGMFNMLGAQPTSTFSAFDVAAPILANNNTTHTAQSIRFQSTTPIYGSGNTDDLLFFASGGSVVMPALAPTLATTHANPFNIAGVAYKYIDLPVTSPFTQTNVNIG